MTKSSRDRLLEILQLEVLDNVTMKQWNELEGLVDNFLEEINSKYIRNEDEIYDSLKEGVG